jgi:hypothetical protein
MDDYEALARDARTLKAVVPELSNNTQVKYGSTNINVNVVGTTLNYVPVNHYRVEAGKTFTAADDASRRRVAVLGYAVPDMLGQTTGAITATTITAARIIRRARVLAHAYLGVFLLCRWCSKRDHRQTTQQNQNQTDLQQSFVLYVHSGLTQSFAN